MIDFDYSAEKLGDLHQPKARNSPGRWCPGFWVLGTLQLAVKMIETVVGSDFALCKQANGIEDGSLWTNCGPTKAGFWGDVACKCDTCKALNFLTSVWGPGGRWYKCILAPFDSI
jgi:hypothetical protein